jgi:DNA-directed RNA polymerase specialized sigma24 family protein
MARIEDIKNRLERWSRWVSERGAQAVGYPRQASFLRVSTGVKVGSVVATGVDEDASNTDKAVHSLLGAHSHLHMTVMLHYAKGYDIKRVAAKMARAESTVRRNLELADVAIQAWFVDRQQTNNFAGHAN